MPCLQCTVSAELVLYALYRASDALYRLADGLYCATDGLQSPSDRLYWAWKSDFSGMILERRRMFLAASAGRRSGLGLPPVIELVACPGILWLWKAQVSMSRPGAPVVCHSDPGHPPILPLVWHDTCAFCIQNRGWVLCSAFIYNTLLELAGFSGRDNGAFTAYLCAFLMRLASRFPWVRGGCLGMPMTGAFGRGFGFGRSLVPLCAFCF